MKIKKDILREAISVWIDFYGYLDLNTSEEEIMNFYNSSPQPPNIYDSTNKKLTKINNLI